MKKKCSHWYNSLSWQADGQILNIDWHCLVLDSAYQKINAKISVTIFISLFQNNTYRNIQIIAKRWNSMQHSNSKQLLCHCSENIIYEVNWLDSLWKTLGFSG